MVSKNVRIHRGDTAARRKEIMKESLPVLRDAAVKSDLSAMWARAMIHGPRPSFLPPPDT